MDCITFRKKIDAYMTDKMDDRELAEFLVHLQECPKCADELEINFIFHEGIRILDERQSDCDLVDACRRMVRKSFRYIRYKRVILVMAYAADTCLFWAILLITVLYFRVFLRGLLTTGVFR